MKSIFRVRSEPKLVATNTCSGRPEIEELYDFRPVRLPVREKTELVRHYVDGKGKKRITGNSQLKKSQRYQFRFWTASLQENM